MEAREKDIEKGREETFQGEGGGLSEEVKRIMLQQPLNPFERVRFTLLPRVCREETVVE